MGINVAFILSLESNTYPYEIFVIIIIGTFIYNFNTGSLHRV